MERHAVLSRRAVTRALSTLPILALPAAAGAGTLKPDRAAWEATVAAYHRAMKVWTDHPCGSTLPGHPMHKQWEEEGHDLMEQANLRLDAVLLAPVPDHRALIEKLEIMVKEFEPEGFFPEILDDVRRLGGLPLSQEKQA